MAIGKRLKALGKMSSAVLNAIIAPMLGRDDLADAVGYVENAGSPVSSLTPDFIGQLCLDTTNSVFYRATGVTTADWQLDASVALTGITAGTPAASKALVLNSALGIGAFRETGRNLRTQAAPTALTVSATLTAAAMIAGLVTGNQGAAGAATYTTDTGTLIETALLAAFPGLANDDSFDFTVINISTVAAETITIAAGASGVTLVGDMTLAAVAVGDESSGTFRVRRTAANTYSIYRLS
jgi:hypothetical protein